MSADPHPMGESHKRDLDTQAARAVSDPVLAYTLLRFTLGVTMLFHGTDRIALGLVTFATSMVNQFSHSFLPAFLVYPFGLTLPLIETAVGALLIAGLLTRVTLVIGALEMVALVFGSTLLQQWMIVGVQLVYAVIYFLLIYDLRHNQLSLDRLLARQAD